MPEKRVFRTREVAERCCVSLRTVQRWIKDDKLPAHRLPGGRDYRIQFEDLKKFCEEYHLPWVCMPSPVARALVVDDEPLMRSLISDILISMGFRVMGAADGFQAGVMLGEWKPHILTLDLSMPRLDGFSVLKAIKERRAEKDDVKVLVVSALDKEELKRAIREGADDAIGKPFSPELLIGRIRALLRMRDAGEETVQDKGRWGNF